MKVSGWDFDGRSQVTSLGRKWVWNRKNCRNYFFWGFSIHQKSETRYISRQNGSWKPEQVKKLDFRKTNSTPRVKILGWDLDGRSQVTSPGRKWVLNRKNCRNYFFWGFSIHQKSETRYKSRQNGSWKPAQVTKWDLQEFNGISWLKIWGWDLDGRSQVTSLGRKWVWKGKHLWNYFLLGYWSIKTRTPGINQDKTEVGNRCKKRSWTFENMIARPGLKF